MPESRAPGLASFWQLQAIGWVGFYCLLLVTAAPQLGNPGQVKKCTLTVILLFAGSILLRPVCRSLLLWPETWVVRELQAFGWSLLTGAGGSCIAVWLMNLAHPGFDWQGWLINLVEFTVVLFLWCSLFLSIK
jgi:hypothetical protein